MKRSLIFVLTIAILLFAFAGVASANQDAAAERLKGFGVIEGFPDGTLGLDRDITRAEFAKIAVLARGMGDAAELLKGTASQFGDVQANAWFTGWINVATSQNIIKGYPDGSFRPNANITYAEAVTMILRTLGYNDNLPGAWPMNYLVKGADLGITSGVVTNASAKAVRGDVFTMLSRSLDEKVVRWDSDKGEFVNRLSGNNEFSLLQQMVGAKEEAKGRVIANWRTDDSLKKNQVRLDDSDKAAGTYTLKVNADVEWLLGLEVTFNHNDKDVYNVNIRTSASDIIFDRIKTGISNNRVELQVADRFYTVNENAVVAINNDDSKARADLASGLFGKFVLKDGRVAAAVLIQTNDLGVVSNIDDGVYEYYYGNVATKSDVDFDDFDKVVLLDRQLRTFDGEIKVGDVIYYFEDSIDGDDVLFVVVSNLKASGELERIRVSAANVPDRLTIGGTTYRVSLDGAVLTTDSGENYRNWNIENVESLLGEEVTVSRDFLGYVMLLSGESEVTGGTLYGLVTWFEQGRNPKVTIFTAEGKEVEYGFETRANSEALAALVVGSSPAKDLRKDVVLVKYELNKDGEIAHGKFALTPGAGEILVSNAVLQKAADRRVVTNTQPNPDVNYFISSSTVFFAAYDGKLTELDPSILTFDSIVRNAFTGEKAVVWLKEGTMEAQAIVFTSERFQGVGEDNFYGIVTDTPWRSADNWYNRIAVAGEGVKQYKVDNKDNFARGNIVEFVINAAGEARVVSGGVKTLAQFGDQAVLISNRDGQFISVPGAVYRVASNAVLYEINNNGGLGDPIRLSRIGNGNYINYILNDDREIAAAIVANPKWVLNSEIRSAVTNLGTVTISADGAGTNFVTQEEHNAYNAAINAARAVFDNPNATVAQIQSAKAALRSATTTFNNAKK